MSDVFESCGKGDSSKVERNETTRSFKKLKPIKLQKKFDFLGSKSLGFNIFATKAIRLPPHSYISDMSRETVHVIVCTQHTDLQPVPEPMEYLCEKCGKQFIKKHKLKEHMMSHDPRQCKFCEKCFRSYSGLRFGFVITEVNYTCFV